MRFQLLFPCTAIGLAALLCILPASAAGSGNLIINGDAETGLCATDWQAVKTVPGWQVLLGQPTQVCHSFANLGTPVPTARGQAFIADGPYGDSALQQQIDVSSAGTEIDGGGVTFQLSGWLGGYGVYGGQAVVTASFLDSSGRMLGTPGKLAGVTATARSYSSQFLARSDSGPVPAGTRSIRVQVQFVNTAGSYNVGYVDQLSLTLSTPVPTPALVPPPSGVPPMDHVFFVMMENTDYAQVIGSANAPFINSLAQGGTLLANYDGVYHPSDENYLAVAGGDQFVSGAIYFPNIHVNAPHLGDLIEAAGKTWKAYEQGMGTPCNTKNDHDSYYQPDDAPFINFTNIAGNPSRCAEHLFDTTQLSVDLASAGTTPAFSWIAADDYYDGEAAGNGSAASVKVQDDWLRSTLQPVFASPAWQNERSLLILTWDESSTGANNRVGTVIYGSPKSGVGKGTLSTASYNHFGAARTIEAALGLPAMTANDRYAVPLNDAFDSNARPAAASLSTAMGTAPRGTNIVFDYSLPLAGVSSRNWIGLYPAGVTPGAQASLAWQYTPAQGGRSAFDTSGLAVGYYRAWLLANDGYTPLAGPIPFAVTP